MKVTLVFIAIVIGQSCAVHGSWLGFADQLGDEDFGGIFDNFGKWMKSLTKDIEKEIKTMPKIENPMKGFKSLKDYFGSLPNNYRNVSHHVLTSQDGKSSIDETKFVEKHKSNSSSFLAYGSVDVVKPNH